MIDWLNKNQGFVSALLTFAYVVTTVALACVAQRSHALAERHLKHALAIERNQARPYVIFDIVFRRGVAFASMKNSGRSAAFSVKVDLEPALVHDIGGRTHESGLTRDRIGCLPPGAELQDLLDAGPGFFGRFKNPIFRGTVSYRDAADGEYQEVVLVDLSVHASIYFTSEYDIGQELHQLVDVVKQLRQDANAKRAG